MRSSKLASRFPGCHPVALTSKNIKMLLDDDYRVAPKIDGESYRMRDHRARINQLRAGLNQGGEFS